MEQTDPGRNAWEGAPRSGTYARNILLEEDLARLNERLRATWREEGTPISDKPVVFVTGSPRSGTTVLMQWLAATGSFCYPSNIISRFYEDPYLGALVQRVLHDHDDPGEIFLDGRHRVGFRSDLGRAKGPTEPHDFGYFWKSHFQFGDTQAELARLPDAARIRTMTAKLRGLQAVFDKPLAMKALQLNWHLSILADAFPNALFLRTERDLADNTVSLLGARRTYFGSEDAWYSFKPAEFPQLASLPAFEQCVGQVHFTNKAIQGQAREIGADRFLKVGYEAFCRDPGGIYRSMEERIGRLPAYQGPDAFEYRGKATPEERERALQVRERLDPHATD